MRHEACASTTCATLAPCGASASFSCCGAQLGSLATGRNEMVRTLELALEPRLELHVDLEPTIYPHKGVLYGTSRALLRKVQTGHVAMTRLTRCGARSSCVQKTVALAAWGLRDARTEAFRPGCVNCGAVALDVRRTLTSRLLLRRLQAVPPPPLVSLSPTRALWQRCPWPRRPRSGRKEPTPALSTAKGRRPRRLVQ